MLFVLQSAKMMIFPKRIQVFVGFLLATLITPQICAVSRAELPQASSSNVPRITKVDPPNWWVGFGAEVMLLISGNNLSHADVACSYPGVSVTKVKEGVGGRYLFVWLGIGAAAQPGTFSINIRGPSGATAVDFPLLLRANPQGDFQGLSGNDVVYMIMPDRFADGDPTNDRIPESPNTYNRSLPRAYHGGDLRGIIDHLPYLRDLGITALWLSPIYQNDIYSPQDYHGYSAVDFYGVDKHFGSVRDFQDLVAAAHQLGIKVILDVVVNHTGPHHPWVEAPPSTDWFHGTPASHLDSTGQFDMLVDPHATEREYRFLLDGWFANVLPDLNQENPLVQDYLVQNNLWWTEISGLDGLRLDTFPYVPRQFWSTWHSSLFRMYPKLTTIGEVFNRDPSVTSFFDGGVRRFDGTDSGVSTLFDFPLYFALRDVIIRGASVGRLVQVLRDDWMYPHPDMLVTFLGNHDVRRFVSEPRSSDTKLKLGFALLFTLRGIPQLYMGDEIGMAGGGDPDNRRDFPGGFPGDPRSSFTTTGRTTRERSIFKEVQSLLRLRRDHPALRVGWQWHIKWDATYYAFLRATEKEKLLVVFNNSKNPRMISLDLAGTPLAGASSVKPVFEGGPARLKDRKLELHVAPRSLAVYEVR